MDVKVFKSLYKPLTWGGIPRVSFISIVVQTIMDLEEYILLLENQLIIMV